MTGNLHAIVFDFDGVIADSERLHLRSYQDILAPEGITMSNEDYFNRYLGYDDVGVFEAVGRDQGVAMDEHRVSELIARKERRYESLAAAGEMLFPGAADFIRSAVAASIPIAIASGALTHEIEDVLERAGLIKLFPVIVGAIRTRSAANRIQSRTRRRSSAALPYWTGPSHGIGRDRGFALGWPRPRADLRWPQGLTCRRVAPRRRACRRRAAGATLGVGYACAD